VEGWEVRAWVAKVGDRLRSLPIPPEFGEALAKVSIDEIRPVRVGHDRPHW
jgi:hypothetical protein